MCVVLIFGPAWLRGGALVALIMIAASAGAAASGQQAGERASACGAGARTSASPGPTWSEMREPCQRSQAGNCPTPSLRPEICASPSTKPQICGRLPAPQTLGPIVSAALVPPRRAADDDVHELQILRSASSASDSQGPGGRSVFALGARSLVPPHFRRKCLRPVWGCSSWRVCCGPLLA